MLGWDVPGGDFRGAWTGPDAGEAGGGGWIGTITGLFGGNPGEGVQINIPTGSRAPSVSQTLTAIVNAGESALQGNLAAWQAQTISTDDAISRAWAILNDVISRCAQYGAEGIKASAERDRRIDPARLRWDWIAYYIDPITGGLSAPQPLPPALSGGTQLPGTTLPLAHAGLGALPADWILIGGALLVLLYVYRMK